ncbi:Helix-turn-helix domain-containing protein [Marisediminitalea aggregata]|uniref:Helix-turn-helix domain-containing protein n=1 Tax=Marisediminitalea aggregata TaxID=634436 RepID=A0A1M5GH64_9ALTE|nr:helix-turn-helix domain-containing protein [Marisediminitalea aggregata]SHG03028.1 Helix-turn-helix domain-containing protein [Marisediminitalea aggregata]
MTYTGTFWSAVLRALLSLRRDKQLNTKDDEQVVALLPRVESNEVTAQQLAQLCDMLVAENTALTGQSLLGYLDFNKMGAVHCYASLSKDIRSALSASENITQAWFQPEETLQLCTDDNVATLVLKHTLPVSLVPFQIAFFLLLFRHLAGRDFEFTAIDVPTNDNLALLTPISRAPISVTEQQTELRLSFNADWLDRQSFFHSPNLQQVLARNFQQYAHQDSENSLLVTLLKAFDTYHQPARIRAEGIAEKLNMNMSTFRRTLRNDDISFSAVLKGYIHEKSVHYLLSGKKVDDVTDLLGFSDRRAFDRSFKEFTGVSPGQLRQIGSRLRFQRGNQALLEVSDNLPPLPETINQIIQLPEEQQTVGKLVALIASDPVFQAHIMGKASRAVYGTTPVSLQQAIGRNLGVSQVRHLAVLFAAQQFLTVQSVHPDVAKLIDAMLLSHTLFQALFANEYSEAQNDILNQVVMFGPLSLLLIFHAEHISSETLYAQWSQSVSFEAFVQQLDAEFNVCLYGASSLLLINWGITSEVNQMLWQLCRGGESLMQQRILLCHQMAFNSLFFDSDVSTLSDISQEQGLSAAQLSAMQAVLEKW